MTDHREIKALSCGRAHHRNVADVRGVAKLKDGRLFL
jgi:hypothetical protein